MAQNRGPGRGERRQTAGCDRRRAWTRSPWHTTRCKAFDGSRPSRVPLFEQRRRLGSHGLPVGLLATGRHPGGGRRSFPPAFLFNKALCAAAVVRINSSSLKSRFVNEAVQASWQVPPSSVGKLMALCLPARNVGASEPLE